MANKRIKAVIFDFGHTIINEEYLRDVPLSQRPVKLMPGVKEVLPKIKLKMGIWANTRMAQSRDIKTWLQRAGLDQYFYTITTSIEAKHRKPDKRFFSYALKEAGLRKDNVLFVGNQLSTDIQGAKEYGISNVYLSGKMHHGKDETPVSKGIRPDYTIKNLKELPAILRKLEGSEG